MQVIADAAMGLLVLAAIVLGLVESWRNASHVIEASKAKRDER